MKQEKRIITWMGYPEWVSNNPREILTQGSRDITLPERVRLYAVRDVVFNDLDNPLYSLHERNEKPVTDPQELKSKVTEGSPILDNNNSLKIYRL